MKKTSMNVEAWLVLEVAVAVEQLLRLLALSCSMGRIVPS
jgi:hypothetical protein